MKKLLPWLIAAFVVWLILRDPSATAADVRIFFHNLSAFVNAL